MNQSQTVLSFYTSLFCISLLFIEEWMRDYCQTCQWHFTFKGWKPSFPNWVTAQAFWEKTESDIKYDIFMFVAFVFSFPPHPIFGFTSLPGKKASFYPKKRLILQSTELTQDV